MYKFNIKRYNKSILEVFSKQISIRQNKINRIMNLFTFMNMTFMLKNQVDDDNHLKGIEPLLIFLNF